MSDKKTTLVIFGFSDGSSEYAVGDHAQEIMQWFNSGQHMLYIHGSEYTGKKMIEVPAPDENGFESIIPIAQRTFPEWIEELRQKAKKP